MIPFVVSILAESRAGVDREGYCDGCKKNARRVKGGTETNRRSIGRPRPPGGGARPRPGPPAELDVRHHPKAPGPAAGEQEQSGGGRATRLGGHVALIWTSQEGRASPADDRPFAFEDYLLFLKLLRGFSQFQADLLAAPAAVDRQLQHVAAVLLIHQALQRLLILNRLGGA